MNESSGQVGSHPRVVSHVLIKRFGDLTGDASEIHFDPEVGRNAGYGGPIAHGLLTACWAVGALTHHERLRLCIGSPNAIQSSFSVRLSRVVRADDLFSLRPADRLNATLDSAPATSLVTTPFETVNQNGERTSSGELAIQRDGILDVNDAPCAWDLDRWTPPRGNRIFYAQDLVDAGPRGRCAERRVTRERSQDFVQHVGEDNPLYLDDAFASRSVFGGCIEPPMLTFCLAFGDFLRDLLTVSMPADGFAGHIGDSWRLRRPVHIGDILHTRHRPLSSQRSKSQPQMAIVRFGIQTVNQNDLVVQDGETTMMIPARAESEDSSAPNN